MNLRVIISASIILLLSLAYLPLLNNHYLLKWRQRRPSSPVAAMADLVVTNGTIYTSDASLPFADSMAVRDGRILRIGNISFVRGVAGFETEELNLQGRLVVPGFIDSHVHLISGGLQMARVELRGVKTRDEFVQKVKEAVTNTKEGWWLLGGGWNNDLWGGEFPTASWIDDITVDHPVWLSRMDGHMGLANSLALRIAGVTNLSEDPTGGAIMKNVRGDRNIGRTIGVGCEYRGLYYLSPPPALVACVTTETPSILHHRSGHPSLQKLQRMVPKLASLPSLECESCQLVVTKGFTQIYGLDYGDTLSPVIGPFIGWI